MTFSPSISTGHVENADQNVRCFAILVRVGGGSLTRRGSRLCQRHGGITNGDITNCGTRNKDPTNSRYLERLRLRFHFVVDFGDGHDIAHHFDDSNLSSLFDKGTVADDIDRSAIEQSSTGRAKQ